MHFLAFSNGLRQLPVASAALASIGLAVAVLTGISPVAAQRSPPADRSGPQNGGDAAAGSGGRDKEARPDGRTPSDAANTERVDRAVAPSASEPQCQNCDPSQNPRPQKRDSEASDCRRLREPAKQFDGTSESSATTRCDRPESR